VFSPADHKYSGSSGCNRLMGTYSLGDKSAISFGTPAGTRMTCMDQKFEDAFNKFFATINHYTVEGKTMKLTNGSSVVMVFEKLAN
jgi:copper homeostasis protein (lipoprotein)